MVRWTVDGNVASCRTASCMAGHVEALRPQLTKKLLPDYQFCGGAVDHEKLARAIWKEETGKECTLDFLADNHPKEAKEDFESYAESVTRKEAVAHIRGSKRWPQLGKETP